ncbi:MAG TPA: hypothetical protein PKW99_06950 [Thauera sp.]|nr:hypothetical protein [Thauera sp.]
MTSPLVLLRIDALGLETFQCHKNEIIRSAAFASGEQRALAEWLRGQARNTRYRAMADFADESFELEALPRVRGSDRRALIARRLSNWYPQPAYATAETLGIDRATRTEQVLFSGLGRPARLEAWLSVLNDAGLASELLISPSRLIAHFLPGSHLVASFSRAGMRLTLVKHRLARLSRMVEAFDAQTVLNDDSWRAEIDRTLHYASSRQSHSSTANAGAATDVVILAPTSALAAQSSSPFAGVTLTRHLDPAERAPLLPDAPATDSSALLLHWLARAPRKLGWPGPNPDAPLYLPRLTALALGAGALLCVGGIALAGLRWQVIQATHDARSALQAEILTLQRERTELDVINDQLDAPPAQIIDIAHQFERERASATPPLAVLRPLAEAIEQTPELPLHTLSWSAPRPDSTNQLAGHPGVQIELTLKPDNAQRSAAIEGLLMHLEAGGARSIELTGGTDGYARLALLLPLNRDEAPRP